MAMIFRIVLLLAMAVSLPAIALERARVVDGDTIRVDGEPVRVMGLDAPEMKGRCLAEIAAARRAKDRMAELIEGGVTLRPHGRDRYRRLLAVVTDSRGRDVAAVMIREGLARPYGGERRRSWCGA
jgi:endonuclease YncB( thermonuclease family)